MQLQIAAHPALVPLPEQERVLGYRLAAQAAPKAKEKKHQVSWGIRTGSNTAATDLEPQQRCQFQNHQQPTGCNANFKIIISNSL